MNKLKPSELQNMSEVVAYWQTCLNDLDRGEDDMAIASHIVGVVSNKNDIEWSEGAQAHPAYGIIFEQAASLELPGNFTGMRKERWDCIRALLAVLTERYRKH